MRDESGGRRKIRINGFLSHVSTMAKMSKLCLKIRAKQNLENPSSAFLIMPSQKSFTRSARELLLFANKYCVAEIPDFL